jgi:hypothetical protein
VPVVDLTSACVAQYKLNDNLGDKVVLDAIGGGNGTSIRNTSAMHTAGRVDGALEFDGAADFVDTERTFQSTFNSAFTINLWCFVAPNTEQVVLFSFATIGGNLSYLKITEQEEGYSLEFHYMAASEEHVAPISLSDFRAEHTGVWTMLTVTVQQSGTDIKGRLYIDAAMVDEQVSPGLVSSYISGTNLFFGAVLGSSTWFTGCLDNFCIFNRVLTQDEIDFLYNEGNGTELLRNDEMATAFTIAAPSTDCSGGVATHWTVNGTSSDITSTAQELKAAVTGRKHCIKSILISSKVATTCTIQDGATAVLGPFALVAEAAPVSLTFKPPIAMTAATAINAVAANTGVVTIVLQGFTV